MSAVSKEHVLKALQSVRDDVRAADIVTLGMIEAVQVTVDGRVMFSIKVDPARGAVLEPLRQQAEKVVAALPGVKQVTAVLTAEKKAPPPAASMDPHGMVKNPPLDLLIRRIVAVASGKGGVGKSTVAYNLAVALARRGRSVGLLDADIYGPSVPRLSGIGARKPDMQDGKLVPLEAQGLKIMSIGFMVEEEAPMIWRGPMVQTALYQMLRDVAWGTRDKPLDILIVDMPPGTGDAQLTLAQKVPLAGAVVVSTPQDLALIDARKAAAMFEKTGVPVLGVIENMSTHVCTACGHEEHIFGHGGARDEAARLGVPFLGEIPLRAQIRGDSDEGRPVPEFFTDIADRLAQQIG